ncbi:hypothetical protein V8F33_008445 [Rhypophila sp. PSN 637]
MENHGDITVCSPRCFLYWASSKICVSYKPVKDIRMRRVLWSVCLLQVSVATTRVGGFCFKSTCYQNAPRSCVALLVCIVISTLSVTGIIMIRPGRVSAAIAS